MNARDEILSTIRKRRTRTAPRPPPYHAALAIADLPHHFAERARAAAAEVRLLQGFAEVPTAVSNILRARNLPARLSVPPDPTLLAMAWNDEPNLTLTNEPPGPDDAALAIAPFAIAETGTLAYSSSEEHPASWHFRAGLEIAIVARDTILPDLEHVLTRLRQSLPHTINLVTGPSRTGDIEQTLELGAHGPKALVILVV